MTRIAIINKEKCKPTKCKQECIKKCPPQRTGKKVIEIVDIEDIGKKNLEQEINMTLNKNKIAKIVENMCIGCNQCVNACPFNAIRIINLPEQKQEEVVHRYSRNGFKLYRIIEIESNCVMSLIGKNAIGKSTIIDILSNKFLPNFEKFDKEINLKKSNKKNNSEIKEIVKHFDEKMKNYFTKLYSNKIKLSIKEQKIKKSVSMYGNINVRDYLEEMNIEFNERNTETFNDLELEELLDNNIKTLSGGELQKLLCWVTTTKDANFYIFDEPTNFLDIKQRIKVSKLIKSLVSENVYVLVIEHDLSMLDYVADKVNIIYGEGGSYGIVSKSSMTISEGLNQYLEGFIEKENTRFREEPFNLRTYNNLILDESKEKDNNENIKLNIVNYEEHLVKYENFELRIPDGNIKLDGSINIILGENATGKSTFMNYLSSKKDLGISHMPQHINIKMFQRKDKTYLTVMEIMFHYIKKEYINPVFKSDIVKTLGIDKLENKYIDELSGGELQKVIICLTLGRPANIYLLDEPSSNLDIENRLECVKVIKKFVLNSKKCVFVIEHDIMISVALSQEKNSKILLVSKDNNKDNLIKKCSISQPMLSEEGINLFLQELDITMRLSNHNRPRINKLNSQIDKKQRLNNCYYGNC